MAFRDNYDFELLVNEAERIIIEELEKQLSEDTENKICKCQDCVLDMAALALNNVKSSYRSSFTGVIYAQQLYDGKYKEEVTKSVKRAIEKVKKNPSHEVE
ncbi:MAG: competence protein ComFB [Spirochaetes bacterium GWD1_27_9]|nr:MAG: competence protein ComFB [Spirochaetes bacterium GWB1_27_13]OHD20386.1 MAG: competence protein ComFB [Spirochaetes bacterium GWC1_27_15]OHD29097.1 MAG: competence protein ComFB [Spirochaetes bacterium GWD1_27_9]